jgi:hypothetical protein
VAAPRWKPEGGPEAVVAAIAEATSLGQLLGRLGVADRTLRRYCAEQGIDLSPASTKPGRSQIPETEEDPAERIPEDTALVRVSAERDHYKRMYNEAITQIASQEDICKSVSAGFQPRPRPVFRRRKPPATKLPKREAVLLLSDWQLGELVHEIETGGVNAYSWAVAEQRARRLVDAVVGNLENQMRAYRITRLVIALIGDMVEGHDIFNGQPWSLEKDAAMQAVDGADLLASVLTAIIEPFLPGGLTVDVYAVPGNHGKPGGRKAGALPVTFSFDLLLYELLKRQLTNWPIREFAVEPAGRLLFTAAEQICLMTHGNEVRGWGGFPFYGLDKTHAKLTMELETLFSFWLLGHWHQAATLPAGRGMRVVNGTMVGANQLTQAAVMTTSAPSQTLLYMSHEYGLAETAYLVLEPGQRRTPTIYGRAA